MHTLAIISKIQNLEPIEGKDRIELATVENYKSVVQKGEFKIGDEVVYVFYDSLLPPKPEFEFLRKRCWSEKWQGHRIKPMKLGNVISEGLVLPMSVLPKKNYKEGQDVTEDLQIRHYDPEGLREMEQAEKKKKGPILTFLFKFGLFRKIYLKIFVKKAPKKSGYPDWIIKSDEENIEKIWEDISKHPETEYIVTEKMEGCLREDTLIQTPKGLRTIKELCDKNYRGEILSYNPITEKTEYKKCLNTLVREPDEKKWYRVETEEGDILYLTENHPIFNPDLCIFREAKDCKVGDSILVEDT